MKNSWSHRVLTAMAMAAMSPALAAAINATAIYDPVSASFWCEAGTVQSQPGVTPPSSTEPLLGVNTRTQELLTIDNATAVPTVIGPVGSPVVGGLAYDAVAELLYGTDTSTNNLVTIDPSTGATTIIGSTGQGLLHGLAMNPTSGVLYASNADGFTLSFLWTVDKTTGHATLVGPIGFNSVAGLDFDPGTGVLYGSVNRVDQPGAVLITIDTANGAGTLVGNTAHFVGLAFETNGDLYGVDNGGTTDRISRLYRVNKTTGEATLIGPIVTGNVLDIKFKRPRVSVQPTSWTDLKQLFRGPSRSK